MRTRSILRYAAVLAVGTVCLTGTSASAETPVGEPDTFTSAFTAMATPAQVVNADGVATPGTAGATGTFNYRLNSDLDIICYDISVRGISTPFESPAKTATHIHQAPSGKPGPPRIAFPNPVEQPDGTFTSSGCLQGPFTTGVRNADTGVDTGAGFTVQQIEDDPTAFFTDTHTAANPAGAVRGQLTAVPLGGVATGGGGTAVPGGTGDGVPLVPIGVGVLVLAGVAVAVRSRATA